MLTVVIVLSGAKILPMDILDNAFSRGFHVRVLLFTLIAGLAGCAKPYIYPGSGTHATPALQAGSARMADGFELPVSVWGAAGEPGAIVLALHGMNDYRKAFQNTGEFLAGHGITVYAYDQRGFGATRGAGYWHGSQALVSDLDSMLRLLRRAHPGLPVYILGESMGGAVTLAAQSLPGLHADGIILIAPAVWSRTSMPWYQRLLLWVAVHTLPGKHLTGEGLDIKPTDNIEMLRTWSRDPLVIKATRVDVLYGVTNLMDMAVVAAHNLHSEALLLYGQHDEIIPRQPTCSLLDTLNRQAGYQADAIVYARGYHMLTRDLHSGVVLRDIADWILSKRPITATGIDDCNAGGGREPA